MDEGKGGKDRPLLLLLPQAHRQTARFSQQSASVNTEKDFMVNELEWLDSAAPK